MVIIMSSDQTENAYHHPKVSISTTMVNYILERIKSR